MMRDFGLLEQPGNEGGSALAGGTQAHSAQAPHLKVDSGALAPLAVVILLISVEK